MSRYKGRITIQVGGMEYGYAVPAHEARNLRDRCATYFEATHVALTQKKERE